MINLIPNDNDGFILQANQPVTLEVTDTRGHLLAYLYHGLDPLNEEPLAVFDGFNDINEAMALDDVDVEPVTTDELWDATPGPEIVADYVPGLDGSAAVTGPSDAHPELRLPKDGYGDLEARLTAIVGSVDGEAYVSRIVSALIAAGVRFEHSDAP